MLNINKRIFATLIVLTLLFLALPLSSAYNPHKINTNLNFSFTDTLATQCNISTMDTPNESVWINQVMSKSGSTYSGIILKNNFSNLGTYCVNIECVDGYGDVCREVTKTGFILDISESVTYSILAFGVLLLFLLSLYFMINMPYSNKTNPTGAVIELTKLKYVKLGLILLTWVLLTWFLNILIGLADNFVSLTMYYGFFGFMFSVMNNLALPLGIIIIIIAFFELIRDSNIQNNISKFGSGS